MTSRAMATEASAVAAAEAPRDRRLAPFSDAGVTLQTAISTLPR